MPRTAAIDQAFAVSAGIGLRTPYHEPLRQPDGLTGIDWLEVHAENYFDPGGIRYAMLCELAERCPISVHGVALSLGSADGVDDEHLERLARLVADINPPLVSEHLAWCTLDGTYYNDLLPLPLTTESLNIVAANVDRVQQRLGRRLLIENPAGYLHLEQSCIAEADFLAMLVARTGCGLLLDVNNLFVGNANLGTDMDQWLATIPVDAIGEMHLAGHEEKGTGTERLLIDSHGAAIAEDVWALFATIIAAIGPRPTLIERDSNLPALSVLRDEAARARTVLQGRP